MTEELIAEARRWPAGVGPIPSAAPGDIIRRLAGALEAVTVERDERELALSAVPGYTRPAYFKQEFERVLRDLVNAEAERDRLKTAVEEAISEAVHGTSSDVILRDLSAALDEGKNDDHG